jgi:hypothetical protein
MTVAPKVGLDVQDKQSMAALRMSRAQQDRIAAHESIMKYAGTIFEKIGDPAMVKYKEDLAAGLPPERARANAQQVYSSGYGEVKSGGSVPPDVFNQVQTTFDPQRYEANRLGYDKWLASQRQQQQDERQGWQTQEDVTPAGQSVRYRYNPGTGQATDLAGKPYAPTGIAAPKGAEAQLYSGEVRDDKGAKRNVVVRMGPSGGWVDTETNEPVKRLSGIRKVGTSGTADPDDPQVQRTAEAIASYQVAPLTGYAMRAPGAQAIMSKVLEINPNFQAARFPEVAKAMRDFGTGREGNTTRSLNVAIDHLDSLSELATALNNTDVSVINRVSNFVKTELGLSSAPNTFEAARSIVGSEVTKAVVGGVSALGDREEARKPIDAARSPQQLADVITQYKRLMAGQLHGLARQYEDATGFGPDSQFSFHKKLDPRTVKELEAARTPNAPGGTQNAGPPVKRDAGGIYLPGSPEERGRLPKGSHYRRPEDPPNSYRVVQ